MIDTLHNIPNTWNVKERDPELVKLDGEYEIIQMPPSKKETQDYIKNIHNTKEKESIEQFENFKNLSLVYSLFYSEFTGNNKPSFGSWITKNKGKEDLLCEERKKQVSDFFNPDTTKINVFYVSSNLKELYNCNESTPHFNSCLNINNPVLKSIICDVNHFSILKYYNYRKELQARSWIILSTDKKSVVINSRYGNAPWERIAQTFANRNNINVLIYNSIGNRKDIIEIPRFETYYDIPGPTVWGKLIKPQKIEDKTNKLKEAIAA